MDIHIDVTHMHTFCAYTHKYSICIRYRYSGVMIEIFMYITCLTRNSWLVCWDSSWSCDDWSRPKVVGRSTSLRGSAQLIPEHEGSHDYIYTHNSV